MDRNEMHQIIMTTFETRNRWSNCPYVVRRNRNYLAKLFVENGLNRGAEVGVRRGDFSLVLCQANPNIEMYCVDPWKGYGGFSQANQDECYKIAEEKLKNHNATLMKMKSMQAIRHFDRTHLDFVYIDGNHRFDHCMEDIIEWSRRVRRGGIVAVHDYSNMPGDVACAVNAYTHGNGIHPWYMTREVTSTAFWVR